MSKMPPLPDWSVIHARLGVIFPEGTKNRNYVVREMAAKTVFVMLYINAVEGSGVWLRPDLVTRMTDDHAVRRDPAAREQWYKATSKPSKTETPGRWYRPNTREPIRDETLRQGFNLLGAVVERPGVPTSSSKGRYALDHEFAALFDPSIADGVFEDIADAWRKQHLSAEALAVVTLRKNAVTPTGEGVLVQFPNGKTRRLAPGPSSNIAKAVIEEFAPRFLTNPGVLWLSESAQKEDRGDAALARALGLRIEIDKNLPDIILVDRTTERSVLFVFVEVVATDGPVTEDRRDALLKLITSANYKPENAAFVTAYVGRSEQVFRRTFASLAWQSFAWCLTEPDRIIGLHVHHSNMKLPDLLFQSGHT